MTGPLEAAALDRLFRQARTRNGWSAREVSETLIREIYDLARLGPTSANVSPGRFVFLTTEAGKARLAPFLSSGNRPKMLAAPVCVIVAHDLAFADRIPELLPHNPGAKGWFADPAVAEVTALRNGSLQGAYLMLAARALGLDCGPMSGFDQPGVDEAFFAGTSWRSNFLCNLGYGTDENLSPRNPRLPFEVACRVV
jgi:3-hydroxypropanoate dehydrogenase